MSLHDSFHHDDRSITAIKKASEQPPPPWIRVYTAAKLMEAIAMHTGPAGETLEILSGINLDATRQVINMANERIGCGAMWSDAGDARDMLAQMQGNFITVRAMLERLVSPHLKHYDIALSLAETGRAYTLSVAGAPDWKENQPFIARNYRANPFVAMDAAAGLTYHLGKLLAEKGMPANTLSHPEEFLQKIHGHGFRHIVPHESNKHDMQLCVNLLGILNSELKELGSNRALQKIFKDNLDIATLLGATRQLAESFCPTSKNQRAEHEKTLRPSATVLEFRPRG